MRIYNIGGNSSNRYRTGHTNNKNHYHCRNSNQRAYINFSIWGTCATQCCHLSRSLSLSLSLSFSLSPSLSLSLSLSCVTQRCLHYISLGLSLSVSLSLFLALALAIFLHLPPSLSLSLCLSLSLSLSLSPALLGEGSRLGVTETCSRSLHARQFSQAAVRTKGGEAFNKN